MSEAKAAPEQGISRQSSMDEWPNMAPVGMRSDSVVVGEREDGYVIRSVFGTRTRFVHVRHYSNVRPDFPIKEQGLLLSNKNGHDRETPACLLVRAWARKKFREAIFNVMLRRRHFSNVFWHVAESASEVGRVYVLAGLAEKSDFNEFPNCRVQFGSEYFMQLEGTRLLNNKVRVHIPYCVVLVTCVEHVQCALQLARRKGWPVSVRGGGHGIDQSAVQPRSLVLSFERMTHISAPDFSNSSISVEAGVTFGVAYERLRREGLMLAGGSCSSVGLTGFHIGGGLGFLSRAFGMGCDNLLAFKMITADGTLKEYSAESNGEDAEVFWAMRGGGSFRFGVIMELTLRVYRCLDFGLLLRGEIEWPYHQMAQVLKCHANVEQAGAYPVGLSVRAGVYWEADHDGPREERTKLRLRMVYLTPKGVSNAEAQINELLEKFKFPIPCMAGCDCGYWATHFSKCSRSTFIHQFEELTDEDEDLTPGWPGATAYVSDPTTANRHSAKNVYATAEQFRCMIPAIVAALDPNMPDCEDSRQLKRKYVVVLHAGGSIRDPSPWIAPSAFDRHRRANFCVAVSNTWCGASNDIVHIGWTANTLCACVAACKQEFNEHVPETYPNYEDGLFLDDSREALVYQNPKERFFGSRDGADFQRLQRVKKQVDPEGLFGF